MKRLFDILIVLLTAPLWLPLLLLLAIIVCIKLGAPVFFRQKRPGLHGAIFEMIKFRTMTDARGRMANSFPMPNASAPLANGFVPLPWMSFPNSSPYSKAI